MKIKCVITDDEPFAVKGISQHVSRISFLQEIATCKDVMELNQLLDQEQVDLLFLDINMPHVSGIEFLKSRKNPPLVIFTTAYDQFALEGYELNVLDYLLKPVSFERFLKAANKAYDYLLLKQAQQDLVDYFFLKCTHRYEKVKYADVLFAESMQNYINLYTTDKRLTSHFTLKALKEYLKEPFFIQTHQSYLVATEKIDAVDGNQLIVGAHQVPISKYMREEVLEKLLKGKLLKK